MRLLNKILRILVLIAITPAYAISYIIINDLPNDFPQDLVLGSLSPVLETTQEFLDDPLKRSDNNSILIIANIDETEYLDKILPIVSPIMNQTQNPILEYYRKMPRSFYVSCASDEIYDDFLKTCNKIKIVALPCDLIPMTKISSPCEYQSGSDNCNAYYCYPNSNYCIICTYDASKGYCRSSPGACKVDVHQ
jgi:hypothetical protein